MFTFTSPITESGKAKRRRFNVEIIEYAVKEKTTQVEIAKLTGLHLNTIIKYVREYEELFYLKYKFIKPEKELSRYDKGHLWKTKKLPQLTVE